MPCWFWLPLADLLVCRVFQHQVLPVRDLRPGLLLLPVWHPAAGRGLLHHQRHQADLRGVQEHPLRTLPQPDREDRVGVVQGVEAGGEEGDGGGGWGGDGSGVWWGDADGVVVMVEKM